MTSTTAMTIPMGSMKLSAAAPPRANTSIISSVAYATEDSGSEEKTGSARTLGRRVCSIFEEETCRPSRTLFSTVPTDATSGDSSHGPAAGQSPTSGFLPSALA
jgi:hypothetical protein